MQVEVGGCTPFLQGAACTDSRLSRSAEAGVLQTRAEAAKVEAAVASSPWPPCLFCDLQAAATSNVRSF